MQTREMRANAETSLTCIIVRQLNKPSSKISIHISLFSITIITFRVIFHSIFTPSWVVTS